MLDVKFGAAAFMPTLEKARELAQAMVSLGTQCGVGTRALLSRMDSPLGRAAGNWLEVKEAVACLEKGAHFESSNSNQQRTPLPFGRGEGESSAVLVGNDDLSDLQDLVLTCAAHLLVQTGKAVSLAAAHQQAADCLASGQPRKKWQEMLTAQGAD